MGLQKFNTLFSTVANTSAHADLLRWSFHCKYIISTIEINGYCDTTMLRKFQYKELSAYESSQFMAQ